jgi:hypothetical protein
MALLTKKEVAQYLLAHGKVYVYSCDDCQEKLITVGELCVVLKWTKRTDGLQAIMGRIPIKVRCMECQLRRHPPKEVLNTKKITSSEASSVEIHPVAQKIILSLIKNNEIERDLLKGALFKKKAIREIKKSDVMRTIRGLRKLKAIKIKQGIWVINTSKRKKKEVAHA